jgi:hypothetical protein
MAKRVVKWSLDGTTLKLAKVLEDPNATAEILAEFDLLELEKALNSSQNLKIQFLAYTAKQKLMDVGASDIGDPDGKVAAAKKKWTELLAGKWAGERVNATGAAENKRIIANVKEASKVVSLEGLIMKKALYPETFTPEDEAKLTELMIARVELTTKNAKKK